MAKPPYERTDVRRVRRNRWWLLLASTPWIVGVLLALTAAILRNPMFLAPLGHAGLFGALAFFFTYKRNLSPRFESGLLRVTAESVSFGDQKLCDRRELTGGFVVPKDGRIYVRLTRKRTQPALLLAVDSEEQGRTLLHALELDASQSVAELRGLSQYFALPAWKQLVIAMTPVIAAFTGFGSALSLLGKSGAPFGVITMVVAVLAMTAFMLAPTHIRVGADGILTRWMGRRRFFAFADIERVDPIEKHVLNKVYLGIQITKKSGETTFLPIGQKRWSEEEFAATTERIREAIDVYKSGNIGANASALERHGRSPLDWVAALRGVGAGANADLRTAPVSTEQLFRILEDLGSPARARASAAVALGAHGSDEDRQRIRIAAEATAAPKLRIALSKASEPETEDEELGTLLAELEASEAAGDAS